MGRGAAAQRVWAICLGLLLAVTLTACGFKLRQSRAYAFDTIAVTPAVGGPVKSELKRYLGERVLDLPPPDTEVGDVSQPQVILDILSEPREKVIVGRSSTGQVREFQLRVRVSFRLRTPDGRELIPVTELVQQRDISFNESAVLAKEAEEQLLYRNMQSDLVQQLLRRLGALKTL